MSLQAVVDFEELGRKCVSTLRPGELTDPLILSIRNVVDDFDCMGSDYQEQVDSTMRSEFIRLCDVLEAAWGESTLARETVSAVFCVWQSRRSGRSPSLESATRLCRSA